MDKNNKQALVDYLEFSLVSFAEGFEQHVDPDAVGELYDRLYGILADIEYTIDVGVELDQKPRASGPVDQP